MVTVPVVKAIMTALLATVVAICATWVIAAQNALVSINRLFSLTGSYLFIMNRPLFQEKTCSVFYIVVLLFFAIFLIGSLIFNIFQSEVSSAKEAVFSNPLSLAINHKSQEIFVANQGDGKVLIIDATKNEVLGEVSSNLKNLYKIAVNSATDEAYAISSQESESLIISLSSAAGSERKFTSSYVSLSYPAREISINKATNKIYVLHYQDKSISVIDGNSKKVIVVISLAGAPTSLAINESQNEIYVTDQTNNQLIIIDGNQNKIASSVKVGLTPIKVFYDGGEGKIFVSNRMSGSVSIIDARQRKVIDEFKAGNGAIDLAFDSGTRKIYAADPSGSIIVYNLSSKTSKNIEAIGGFFPEKLALDEAKDKIFVSAGGKNKILVIDGETDEIIKTFDIGGQIQEIVFDAELSRLYGLNSETNNLFIIDSESDSYDTIGQPTATSPEKVIYGPVLLCSGINNLFVANFLTQSLSVFDQEFHFIKSIPVKFDFPGGGFTSAKEAFVFSGNNEVLIFPDSDSIDLMKRVEMNGSTVGSTFFNGDLFVVTKEGMLNVINLESGAVVKSLPLNLKPLGIKVMEPDNKIYISSFENNKIIVLDATNYSLIKDIPVDGPIGLRTENILSRRLLGRRLYVVSFREKKVLAFDTREDRQVKEWQMDFISQGLSFGSDINKIYVSHPFGEGISIINLENDEITHLPVPTRSSYLGVDLRENKAYAVYAIDKVEKTLSVFDARTDTLITTLRTGVGPSLFVLNSEGGRLYVPNNGENSVSVFNVRNINNFMLEATILSDGSVIWAQDERPVVTNIFMIIWQWIISHKKASGAILSGIILMIFGFIFLQRKKKMSPGL